MATKAAEQPPPRSELIADAAMRVLAAGGARGLSHTAVDTAAGLPRGSTSNYFNSRDELLTAVLERHLELDTPPRKLSREDLGRPLSRDEVRGLLLGALDRRLDPDRRHILGARYELFLESTRRPAFQERLFEAHDHFLAFLESLLEAGGCRTSNAHAAGLLATLDGIVFTQLTFGARGLDPPEIEALVDRLLADC